MKHGPEEPCNGSDPLQYYESADPYRERHQPSEPIPGRGSRHGATGSQNDRYRHGRPQHHSLIQADIPPLAHKFHDGRHNPLKPPHIQKCSIRPRSLAGPLKLRYPTCASGSAFTPGSRGFRHNAFSPHHPPVFPSVHFSQNEVKPSAKRGKPMLFRIFPRRLSGHLLENAAEIKLIRIAYTACNRFQTIVGQHQ